MPLSRVFATLVVLAALHLDAQVSPSPVSTDPPDPTSADSVTLLVQQYDFCTPPPAVTRSGFEIDVTLYGSPCGAPPRLVTWRLDLGMLAPGEYTVILGALGEGVHSAWKFEV